MSDWLHLIGWPPSIITGGLLIFLSLGYGTQARKKLRPILLAVQVALITLIISALMDGVQQGVSGHDKRPIVDNRRRISQLSNNWLANYQIMLHHSAS